MELSIIFNELLNLSDKVLVDYAKKLKGPDLRELQGRMIYVTEVLKRVTERNLFKADVSVNNAADEQTSIKKDVFTVKEFADELKCSENHVRNMIKKKKLQFEDIHATGKRKQIRIPLTELERLQKKQR